MAEWSRKLILVFGIIAHHFAKFHQHPMKELVGNAVKTLFEEGLGLEIPTKGNWVRNFENIIFLIKSWILVEAQQNR